MDNLPIKEEQFDEPTQFLSEQNEVDNESTFQDDMQFPNFSLEETETENHHTNKGLVQLADPTWFSYEYQQIHGEIMKLDEKLNLILSIIEKKPRKNTITEVNSKVDSIIEKLNKKGYKKRKLGSGEALTVNSEREWSA